MVNPLTLNRWKWNAAYGQVCENDADISKGCSFNGKYATLPGLYICKLLIVSVSPVMNLTARLWY